MGIRRLIGNFLRRLAAHVLPVVRLLALSFGRRPKITAGSDASVIEVHDRGSDVTIVAFAGLAAMHGGMVNYEFQGLLRNHGLDVNLIFVRDVRCACYHVAPNGAPNGLAFYEEKIREALTVLRSRHNVAIGTSIGGMAALYFGAKCGMSQVLAFSPSWPLSNYFLPRGFGAWLSRVGQFFREPQVWIERQLLARMGHIADRAVSNSVGREAMLDLGAALRGCPRLPSVTVFFGEGCEPDARTAHELAATVPVTLEPQPTFVHNTTGYLKQRGELATAILGRVEGAMRVRGVTPRASTPPPPAAVTEIRSAAS